MRALSRIADFFYPRLRCPVCLTFHEGLCITCRASFLLYDQCALSESESGISMYRHQESVKILISNYKKKMIFSAGDLMATLITEKLSAEEERFDFITFAPSSKSSLKKLGFDHGAYLAKRIGRQLDIPIRALFRPSDKEQKVLERDERCENAKKIALLSENMDGLKGKRGVLVDDVYTTGSTVTACLALMKMRGIEGKYITFSRI